MDNQMRAFADGGLKQEGGMVDEESGNDVPLGSTRAEVRDDIDAKLSEGEFVFPADVVRYFGLEKLMKLREQAKNGLQKMNDMGQMGNSDEATLPDDIHLQKMILSWKKMKMIRWKWLLQRRWFSKENHPKDRLQITYG
jgi:hypothetical protein